MKQPLAAKLDEAMDAAKRYAVLWRASSADGTATESARFLDSDVALRAAIIAFAEAAVQAYKAEPQFCSACYRCDRHEQSRTLTELGALK